MTHKPHVDIWAVFGSARSGKSTGVKELLKSTDIKRIFVFDSVEEYYNIKGFIKVTSKTQLLKAMQKTWSGGCKIAYVPNKSTRQEEFAMFCRALISLQGLYYKGKDKRQILLIAEELNELMPNNGGANVSKKYKDFGEICSRGGHYGIHLIGVSQRPSEVHGAFRGQLQKVRCYRLGFVNDIDKIQAMVFNKQERHKVGESIFYFEAHNYVEIKGSSIQYLKNEPLNKKKKPM